MIVGGGRGGRVSLSAVALLAAQVSSQAGDVQAPVCRV